MHSTQSVTMHTEAKFQQGRLVSHSPELASEMARLETEVRIERDLEKQQELERIRELARFD